MVRTVSMVIGDWSGDGHEQSETVNVTVSGDDVSDAALAASYSAMVEQLGVDLSDIVCDYENAYISASFYEQLLEAGFVSNLKGNFSGDTVIYVEDVVDEDGDEVELGAVELVMFYVGSRIPNFAWEIQRDTFPLLLGGSGTILTQKNERDSQGVNITKFGYGLMG